MTEEADLTGSPALPRVRSIRRRCRFDELMAAIQAGIVAKSADPG